MFRQGEGETWEWGAEVGSYRTIGGGGEACLAETEKRVLCFCCEHGVVVGFQHTWGIFLLERESELQLGGKETEWKREWNQIKKVK